MIVKNILAEARRRRVFRAAGLYIVAAWVVVQIALAAFPALSISETAVRYVWLAALLGFPLAMVFGWRYDIRGGRLVKTGPDSGDVPLTLQRTDFIILAAIGVVTVIIMAGSLREITLMDSPPEQSYSLADIDSASVAVLPFANMSADPNNEYFSDGLTETLLHMLAQLDDLKVAARTSSFAFKGQNLDIRDIARQLGVAHVLEGSVQRAGESVRVTAQLIRAEDGFHVWSQNYDRKLDDIFAIQDEISTDVAAALGSSLLTNSGIAIHNIDTEDFSTYDIFLQALAQLNINSSDSLLEAQRLFRIAIDKDPEFIDAKLGLARNFLELWNRDIDDLDRFDLDALALLSEILEQQPDNLSAQIMELLTRLYIGRMEKKTWTVEPELQALVDEIYALAQTGDIEPYLTHSIVYLISGVPRHQDEEALEMLRGAIESDPLNIELLLAQANLFRDIDRPEEAKQPLLTAARVAPQNPQILVSLASLARSQRQYAEALEWYRQARVLDSNDPIIVRSIAAIFYEFEFEEEGDHWSNQLRAMNPEPCFITLLDVWSAKRAGDTDRLIEMLTRDLARLISERAFCYNSIDLFVFAMSDLGQSQQAVEFLSELIPGLTDYSTIIRDNRWSMYFQYLSVMLQKDSMDSESHRELYATYQNALTEAYPNWGETVASVYLISQEVMEGDLDGAKTMTLETYTPETYYDWWRWEQFLRYPWLQELREDPEVALLIEDYLRARAEYANDVRELLDQPEWSH